MKPPLLILNHVAEHHIAQIAEHFEVIYAPNANLGADRSNGAVQIAARGSEIRAVLTNGTTGLLAAEMDAMPALKLVCAIGVGYENVDIEHARARGITVVNGAGTNADCVADHAMMLLLGAVRRLPFLNAGVRQGMWREDVPRPSQVSHRRMGIIGLGAIGKAIAHRGRGFHMDIGYYSRTRRDETGYRYFDDVADLAKWCDYLVVAAPGGKDTLHMVDAKVLDALGPQGVLVNIARGSLVDTQAVADALRDGRILAAALDVYESEPTPPAALLEFDNAILTPHMGGVSPQSIDATVQRFLDNAERFYAGEPLISPVE